MTFLKIKRRCKKARYEFFYTSVHFGLDGVQPSFCRKIHLNFYKMKSKTDRNRIQKAGIPGIFKGAVKTRLFYSPFLCGNRSENQRLLTGKRTECAHSSRSLYTDCQLTLRILMASGFSLSLTW